MNMDVDKGSRQYMEPGYQDKRILLVEDNDINADIVAELLEVLGITVEHVWNGLEAVERLNKAEDGYYDMVFMDIQMPVMNGYDAVRAIRASDREYFKNIPIVAISANVYKEDVSKALESGMNDHLAKPLNFDILCNAIKTWIPAD